MKNNMVVFLIIVSLLCSTCSKTNNSISAEEKNTNKTQNSLIIDNIEDGDNKTLQGFYWYSYDDLSNKGNSLVNPQSDKSTPFIMSVGGSPNSTKYHAKMTGRVTTKYQYGFIGMGLDVKYTNSTGISFWTKGDGKKYNVRIETSDITDFAYYQYEFVTTNIWRNITIKYDEFSQPESFGDKKSFNSKNIVRISFQTIGQPLNSVELAIDDLSFIKE